MCESGSRYYEPGDDKRIEVGVAVNKVVVAKSYGEGGEVHTKTV